MFRFLLFMIFYALLDISHWWVVTATTTGTVAFLVAKVGCFLVVEVVRHIGFPFKPICIRPYPIMFYEGHLIKES